MAYQGVETGNGIILKILYLFPNSMKLGFSPPEKEGTSKWNTRINFVMLDWIQKYHYEFVVLICVYICL